MTPFQKKIRSLTRRKFLPRKPYDAKPKLKPEELEQLVIRLKGGDNTVINEIVEAHMRLGISIAARYASNHPKKVDDLIGVMGLALVKSVWKAKRKLIDNNITPFITSYIHGELMKFIEEDRCVHIPGRTVRHYANKGDSRLEKPPVQVPLSQNDFNEEENNESFRVVIEIRDQSLLEVNECLDKAATTIIEKRIIELRAEGHTYVEISPQVGYSKSKIEIIVNSIEEKFSKYFGA